MQITPLLGPVGQAATGKTTTDIAGDFDRFLTLLTTQLQNQDPLAPMDATQFTNQLVQFSQVEQSVAMNQRLLELIEIQQGSRAQTAIAYVGRTVDALGEEVPLAGARADLFYAVDGQAAAVSLELLDTSGRIVRRIPGSVQGGLQRAVWDGKDAAGRELADGTYGLRLVARDAAGNVLKGQTGFAGKVEQVTNGATGLELSVGGVTVPMDRLVSVRSGA